MYKVYYFFYFDLPLIIEDCNVKTKTVESIVPTQEKVDVWSVFLYKKNTFRGLVGNHKVMNRRLGRKRMSLLPQWRTWVQMEMIVISLCYSTFTYVFFWSVNFTHESVQTLLFYKVWRFYHYIFPHFSI